MLKAKADELEMLLSNEDFVFIGMVRKVNSTAHHGIVSEKVSGGAADVNQNRICDGMH